MLTTAQLAIYRAHRRNLYPAHAALNAARRAASRPRNWGVVRMGAVHNAAAHFAEQRALYRANPALPYRSAREVWAACYADQRAHCPC